MERQFNEIMPNLYEVNATCNANTITRGGLLELVIFGVIMPSVCLIGLIGNLLSLVIFSDRKSLPAPSYIYLSALAIAHSVTLVAKFTYLTIIEHFSGSSIGGILISTVNWALSTYGSSLSTCFLAELAVERYIFVKSLSAPSMIVTKQRQRSARISIGVSSLVILLFNIPRMTAFKLNYEEWCLEYRWPTSSGSWYAIYSIVWTIVQNGFLIVAIVFNSLLIATLCSKRALETLARDRQSCICNEQRKLTTNLVFINVFIIFNELVMVMLSPMTIWLFWSSFGEPLQKIASQPIFVKTSVSLCIFEYSFVFVISYMFNSSFRQRFQDLYLRLSIAYLNKQPDVPQMTRVRTLSRERTAGELNSLVSQTNFAPAIEQEPDRANLKL